LAANAGPVHAFVTFTPMSPPFLFSDGTMVAGNPVSTRSSASDGTFSISLEAGTYSMTCYCVPSFTISSIVVPATGGPYAVDTLVAGGPSPLDPARAAEEAKPRQKS
jgi:hypothetical protein